jgi:hypothetical protein
VEQTKLLALLKVTPIGAETKKRIRRYIEADFAPPASPARRDPEG